MLLFPCTPRRNAAEPVKELLLKPPATRVGRLAERSCYAGLQDITSFRCYSAHTGPLVILAQVVTSPPVAENLVACEEKCCPDGME